MNKLCKYKLLGLGLIILASCPIGAMDSNNEHSAAERQRMITAVTANSAAAALHDYCNDDDEGAPLADAIDRRPSYSDDEGAPLPGFEADDDTEGNALEPAIDLSRPDSDDEAAPAPGTPPAIEDGQA